MHGEYREIVRPGRIVHTEFFSEGEYLVTSSITAKGDTTTLTITMRFASRGESCLQLPQVPTGPFPNFGTPRPRNIAPAKVSARLSIRSFLLLRFLIPSPRSN